VNRERRQVDRLPQPHSQGIDLQTRRQPLLAVVEFVGVETLGEEVPANSVLLVRRPSDRLFQHDHPPTDTAEPPSQFRQPPGLGQFLLDLFRGRLPLEIKLPTRQPEPAADNLLGRHFPHSVRAIAEHHMDLIVQDGEVEDVDCEHQSECLQTKENP
jgi:hypothetical protein